MIFRAKDIDVAFELVFLAIGAPGLDDIIVDAGRNNLAVITAVPPASRVLIMVKLFAPPVEYPTFKLDNRFVGDLPLVVHPGAPIRRKDVWGFEFRLSDRNLKNRVALAIVIVSIQAHIGRPSVLKLYSNFRSA